MNNTSVVDKSEALVCPGLNPERGPNSRTHVTEINDDLPYPAFIQSRICAAELPQELREVPGLTQLCLNVQRLVLLPTINIRKNIRMASSFIIGTGSCLG